MKKFREILLKDIRLQRFVASIPEPYLSTPVRATLTSDRTRWPDFLYPFY